MGLFRTVFEMNGFSVKNRKLFFPTAVYIPAEGIPLEFGNGGNAKKIRVVERVWR